MKRFILAIVLLALLRFSPVAFAASGCAFPTSLDSFSDVASGQVLTASLYNKLQCASEKLQAMTAGTSTVILSAGVLTLHSTFIDGSQFYCPDSGSTDAYVCSRNKPATAYTTGMWVDLRPNTVNTGAATLTLDSIGGGAKTITQHDGTALTDGLLAAGRIYRLQYHADGTFRMAGGQGAGGSGTVSGSTGKLAKFTAGTVVGDSSIADDGAGTISYGNVTGNYHSVAYAAPTAVRTHTFPDQSGHITYNKSISFVLGSDGGTALVDTDDQPTIWRNNVAALTITEIWCESDGGTPRIQLRRNDGSPVNILTDNAGAGLDCTTSGATGTIDTAEDNLAVGNKLDFVMVTAGGVAKRVTVNIKATLD